MLQKLYSRGLLEQQELFLFVWGEAVPEGAVLALPKPLLLESGLS